jgi:hypothetical protein
MFLKFEHSDLAISEVSYYGFLRGRSLTPKIPGPFLPISTSKMLKFSKKCQNKIKNKKC